MQTLDVGGFLGSQGSFSAGLPPTQRDLPSQHASRQWYPQHRTWSYGSGLSPATMSSGVTLHGRAREQLFCEPPRGPPREDRKSCTAQCLSFDVLLPIIFCSRRCHEQDLMTAAARTEGAKSTRAPHPDANTNEYLPGYGAMPPVWVGSGLAATIVFELCVVDVSSRTR